MKAVTSKVDVLPKEKLKKIFGFFGPNDSFKEIVKIDLTEQRFIFRQVLTM